MKTTMIGQLAEQAAAEELVRLGYEVVARNWRTRFCEIDIVARKGSTMHFVEVKYRASRRYGAGLEYITSEKVHRMQRAAIAWTRATRWPSETNLAAIEVSGPNLAISTFVPTISS